MTGAQQILAAAVEKTGQALTPQQAYDTAVAEEAGRLRVREAARQLVEQERRQAVEVPPFDAGTLAEILARPPEPPHRIEQIMPSDGGLLIVAQRKTGKTTLQLNLARCLLTGETFLGRFGVRPVTGTVALLNFEVSAAQLGRWAADADVPADRLYLVNLRGRRNPLQHPNDRAQLAAVLREREVESLLVDPFGRAYSGQSQNDAGEVGAWLADLDRFARADVGAVDLVLSAHAGWDAERTRGASALEDWADSIITLVRAKDDPSRRFLRATGRDVEVDEDELHYDPNSRRLTLAGSGSRKTAAAARHLDDLAQAIVAIVAEQPGLNLAAIAKKLTERGMPFTKGDDSKAARAAEADGRLIRKPGRGTSLLHYIPDDPRPTPTTPQGAVQTTPDPPLVQGGSGEGHKNPTTPETAQQQRAALHLVADRLGATPIQETP